MLLLCSHILSPLLLYTHTHTVHPSPHTYTHPNSLTHNNHSSSLLLSYVHTTFYLLLTHTHGQPASKLMRGTYKLPSPSTLPWSTSSPPLWGQGCAPQPSPTFWCSHTMSSLRPAEPLSPNKSNGESTKSPSHTFMAATSLPMNNAFLPSFSPIVATPLSWGRVKTFPMTYQLLRNICSIGSSMGSPSSS